MKQGKCETPECTAEVTSKCHIGNDSPAECPKWKMLEQSVVSKKRKVIDQKFEVSWSGDDYKIGDIEKISRRSSPLVIGIAGHENSGKTSFLGALFTLLVNGHGLQDYTFAGSETLIRWEYLMRRLRFDKGKVSFPPPTPSGGDYYSFLHLMMRTSTSKLKDILFADLSGEVFGQWTVDKNAPGVDNVRWVTNFANGFIFFVNAKTIAEKRMAGVNDILDMAQRLKDALGDRPIIAVWSKADEIEHVNPQHVQRIEQELKVLFTQRDIYQISNYLDVNAHPDPKSLNNLYLLDELLNKLSRSKLPSILIENKMETSDLFLTYRGHGK